MNGKMQADYRGHVLRRNWRAAVQVLGAALDLDPTDQEALQQMEDQRARFLQQAQAILNDARRHLANGSTADVHADAQRLNEKCPEWVDLCDSDEVLITLWNATRIPNPVPEPDPVITETPDRSSSQAPLLRHNDREASLTILLGKVDSTELSTSSESELEKLERELTVAELDFALGVPTGKIKKSDITRAIAGVRERRQARRSKTMFLTSCCVILMVAVFIVTGVAYWRGHSATPGEHPKKPGASQAFLVCNPKPMPDDFVLPMPHNAEMAFRAIVLPSNQPNHKQSQVLGFEAVEPETGKLKVYAPFSLASGTSMYYLGKYEVTEGQYNAIMGTENPRSGTLPVCNISYEEAKDFCNRFTQWLHGQGTKLPTSRGGQVAVVRLPVSAEWEFAARGGAQTYGTAPFRQRFPYLENDLNRFEWFGGPKSSYNGVHPVGQLNPNALGCFDLLGNVREITRADREGVVARGGDFLTPEAEMSVALKTEHPFFAASGGPFRQERRGFRVVLGTAEIDWHTAVQLTPPEAGKRE